jgi:hypothetical protein
MMEVSFRQGFDAWRELRSAMANREEVASLQDRR